MQKQFLLPMAILMALMSCQKQNPREAGEVKEDAVMDEAATSTKLLYREANPAIQNPQCCRAVFYLFQILQAFSAWKTSIS